jgi:hypothetical protein
MRTTKQPPATMLPKRTLGSAEDLLPCRIHQGLRNDPSDFDVYVMQGDDDVWKASLAPIPLENDGDTVVWHLEEVFAYFNGIQNAWIEFFKGPADFDPDCGPFIGPPLFKIEAKTLTAAGRNHLYGSCYCYNIVIQVVDPTMAVSPGASSSFTLFPIDPEIDNLAPPPPP